MSAKISNAFELIQTEIACKRKPLQNLDERLFPNETELHPKPKSLIEIAGGGNGCGKSHLLQYITALAIIPSDFGGKQSRVILIDQKYKFDPDVFLGQVKGVIKTKIGNIFTESELTDDHVTQVALDSLRRLTVTYAFSPDDLAHALDDVENMLMEDENGEISTLAIDGLNLFYWIENFERKRRMSTHCAQLVERLRDICNKNNITCAYTHTHRNYVEARGNNTANTASTSSDYRFVLNWKPGLERTLNGSRVYISRNGLQID